MILIVGLGNPGKKYEKTRHNVGSMVIDKLFMVHSSWFTEFEFKKKLYAEVSQGKINNQKIILAKPQTFMNKSGKSVKKLIENWKLKIENLVVIHDDVDLPLGTIKISQSAGSAGHKGIQSIIEELKTQNFTRIRIGIRPAVWPGPRKKAEEFVLKKFAKEEKKTAKKVIEKAAELIEGNLKTGIEKTTIKA